VPEMTDLKNIDLAFLPLSQPYNMTPEMLVEAAALIHPKELIPYHYDNNDISTLLTLMKAYPDIKVLTGQGPVISEVSKNELDDNLAVCPNPAGNVLNIKNLKRNSEVTIFDLNGKVVFSKFVQENQLININRLPKGFYSLLEKFNNETRVAKFIKL